MSPDGVCTISANSARHVTKKRDGAYGIHLANVVSPSNQVVVVICSTSHKPNRSVTLNAVYN